jgi:hypothetical protein
MYMLRNYTAVKLLSSILMEEENRYKILHESQINTPIPCIRILPNLTVTQLMHKFTTIYVNQMFTTIFIKAWISPYPQPRETNLHYVTYDFLTVVLMKILLLQHTTTCGLVRKYKHLFWTLGQQATPKHRHLYTKLIRSNKMQQYAGIYLLQNHSTCFGCPSHPSSVVHKTVTAASDTGHSIWATTFLQCDL